MGGKWYGVRVSGALSWIPAFAGMTYREDRDKYEIIFYAKQLFQQSLSRGRPKTYAHLERFQTVEVAQDIQKDRWGAHNEC